MDTANSISTAQAAAANRKVAETSNGMLSSDFQTFLRMLTTQMENQDPLNPMESSDFAVQLATFSGVEQQVRTNDLLTSLQTSLGSGIGQISGWVGMEARAAVPAHFDGTPLTLFISPDAEADSASVIVRDAQGNAIAREAVSPDGGEVLWAGMGADGTPLPPGSYRFDLESRAGGETLSVAPIEVYAEVTEARIENGTAVVGFGSGATAPVDSITALRKGGSAP